MASVKPVSVVMAGTGEYTTGYIAGQGGSKSDKKVGVVALVMFDLRRRGKVSNLALAGTNGTKFAAIRTHLKEKIGDVYRMDTSCKTFPTDTSASAPQAYKEAIDSFEKGDIVTIFTPDDTHFEIALYAIQKGLHVLLTKPPVKTVKEQQILIEEARKHNVLVTIDYHKRWDPIYVDARFKIKNLGDFGYFFGYMSQPKFQLTTFKAWAGKSSDISYYLNSHHVDVHVWSMETIGALPLSCVASAATGVAESEPYGCPKGTEDTITLLVTWRNKSGTLGTAVYTASWSAAAKSEVHSQQHFKYMGHKGEVRADQAHRGYEVSTDETGYGCINPLYMSYQPSAAGLFQGQHGYGYRSLESLIDAANDIRAGKTKPADYESVLPTICNTILTTAILEAGRISLDSNGARVNFVYNEQGHFTGLQKV